MPELPEAEANRRRIEASCLRRTIESVRLGDDTSHVDLPGPEDRGRLTGRQFTEARRHGKIVFAGSASGPWIAVRLGMTGSLRPFATDDGPPDFARLVIAFEGGTSLAFRCPRKLGSVAMAGDPAAFVASEGLGPDALKIDRETFRDRVGGSRGAVKSALMAQAKLAGIGNLWSDESLFRTGLHPAAKASALPGERIDALFDATRAVLKAVAETDADYSRLPGDWLISHREAGAECRRCGGEIAKQTVSGRSAYFCRSHQEAS